MKYEKTINTLLAFAIFLFFLIFTFLHLPQYHWWKTDYERNMDWCEMNKPMFNLSLDSERVKFCYGEGWKDYCLMSYPTYCPEGIKPYEYRREE